jgi:dipeptide/tripeptide permease
MENNNKKSIIPGYVMVIIGFFLILYNALNYIFGWNEGSTPLFVIGIVFLVVGMGIVKKSRQNK